MTGRSPARRQARAVGALRGRRALTAQPKTPFATATRKPSWMARKTTSLLTAGRERLLVRNAAIVAFENVVVMPVTVPGSRSLAIPLRVVGCVDESGSTSTSDPGREAHRAVLHACDWLRDHSQNERDQIGLVRFADRATKIRPVQAARARSVLETALRHDPNIGGGTQLIPALDATTALLGHRRSVRRVALILTDGQTNEPAEQLRERFDHLRANADAVYLLALDADHGWATTEQLYASFGLTEIIPVTQHNQGELAAIIAALLAHEAGLATL